MTVRSKFRGKSVILKDFSKQTTIHGLYDLISEKSATFRIIWILVFCFAVGMLVSETIKVVKHYLKEPTVSHITTTVPTNFPEIVFCPATHIDPVKAEKYGMTRNVYRYYKSMFTWASFFEVNYFDLLFDNMSPTAFVTNHKADIYKIVGEFQKFVITNNIGRMTDLMELVGFNAEDVITVIDQMHRPTMRVSNKILLNHICFKVEDLTNYTEMEITHVNFQFYINDLQRVFPPYNEHDTLYIGHGLGIAPFGSISVAPFVDYSISLTAVNFKRQNLRRQNCMENTIYADRDVCAFTCLNNELCRKMANCSFPVPWDDNITDICSMYKPVSCIVESMKNTTARQLTFEKCYDGCPKPCEMWLYQVVVTPTKRAQNSTRSHFRIKYADPSNSMQVIEVLTETWSSLFASIGGTFSLWIGASLISFVQLCTFVCTAACRKSPSADSDRSDRTNFEMKPAGFEQVTKKRSKAAATSLPKQPPVIRNDFSLH